MAWTDSHSADFCNGRYQGLTYNYLGEEDLSNDSMKTKTSMLIVGRVDAVAEINILVFTD